MRNDDFYIAEREAAEPVLLLEYNGIRLTRPTNYIVRAAKDLGASIVIVDQRYTGTSLPTKEFSVGTLKKLLTVPQSVQDVALTVAALARKYYPLTFDGAILSSAPLKFQLEDPEYTKVLGKDFSNRGLGGSTQCLSALKEAHSAIGEKLASPEGRRQLEKTFNIHEGDLEAREVQTAFTLHGRSTGLVVQNNDPLCKGEYCNVEKVCKKLTEGPTPLDMLATIYKARHRGDLAAGVKEYLARLKDEKIPSADRMREFRICSSRGLISTCNSATCSFFTRSENSWFDYGTWLCREGFGISKEDILQGVEELRKYVGDFRNTTNILSINGDADPWYPSSIFREGEGPEVQMVGNASHCYWCSVDDGTVLERIRNVIQKWLE
ncbi:Thymus-specific serine protease [Perkinsus chesapeaki]|uniref:Thymus-specific serine protease n=1 Tax=Perkinsus chesapeaki TaxID=330153 RepID=A0A7J6KX07_PERCH|nr:Thymus-specific serine protease [Perkinsus chesapeaki]